MMKKVVGFLICMAGMVLSASFLSVSGANSFSSSPDDGNLAGAVAAEIGVYNVLVYGAMGDGKTDDSEAIQAAMDACIGAGRGTIKIPPLDYVIRRGLKLERACVKTEPHIVIEAYGANIIAPDDLGEPVLTIGASGERINHVIVRGGTWGYDGLETFLRPNSACIKVFNGANITMYDVEALYGHDGILLAADSTFGNAYNIVYNSSIRTCLNAIHLDSESNEGWVNENLFHGGRISYAGGKYDASSGFAISITVAEAPTHIMNRNRFVDMSVECNLQANKPTMIFDQFGSWNKFIRLRNEGFSAPLMTFGPHTKWDLWDGSVSSFKEYGAEKVVAAADRGKVALRLTTEEAGLVSGKGLAAVEAGTANDTSPSVGGSRYLKLPANSRATVISQLDDGAANQTVTLVSMSSEQASRINDGGNFRLSGDWNPNVDDTLTLFSPDGTRWFEVCRSNN